MTASASDVARLRRLVNEPTTTTYDDDALAEYIERYPVTDSAGLDPEDAGWAATYDLNAAAADIWGEKAAALQGQYDFSADGGSYSRGQQYEQAVKMANYYAARRRPTSRAVRKWPPETLDDTV